MLIVFILLSLLSASVLGAGSAAQNWNGERITGSGLFLCHLPGNPFFNDSFFPGKIELTDGTIIEALQLKYSSYRDELIYYNSEISTQIVIDKMSLRGFSLTDEKVKSIASGYKTSVAHCRNIAFSNYWAMEKYPFGSIERCFC